MKYERLQLVCFQCGRMDHELRLCKMAKVETVKCSDYGVWLKAEDYTTYKPKWEDEGPDSVHTVFSPGVCRNVSAKGCEQIETKRLAVIFQPETWQSEQHMGAREADNIDMKHKF